jgi:Mrp family chromosome partitioning ATPase
MDAEEELEKQLEKQLDEVRRRRAAQGSAVPRPVVRRRRPKMIAVFSYKGGVAKSTTVINLAATLAQMGRKTLVVDCDTQARAVRTLPHARPFRPCLESALTHGDPVTVQHHQLLLQETQRRRGGRAVAGGSKG